jgi:hypothetical protein
LMLLVMTAIGTKGLTVENCVLRNFSMRSTASLSSSSEMMTPEKSSWSSFRYDDAAR